jgi:hypothetical protein
LLLPDAGGYVYAALPETGVLLELELVVILIRRERRGRRAWREPAMMPMPSSVRDQKPILPVP